MKVEAPVIPIDRSSIKNELSFDIGDKGMVFSILRKQMYPNPVKTFIQELMSNQRDAHREAGKADMPIDVQLPTSFNPEIIFRDYGPGIDPDRMANVFIKYGSSTKRGSNDQTGGFGLGAKTPLAYTDSFAISTFIPDAEGNMRRRVYTVYVDETNVGKLAIHDDDLDGEIVIGEKQGTMIKVSCKPGDTTEFAKWVRHTGTLWGHDDTKDSVLPNVIGADWNWTEQKIALSGDKWFCCENDGYNWQKKDPIAVIDGIQYKLSWDHLKMDDFDAKAKEVFNALFYKSLFVFFETGEVPVAATREEIEYTDAAKELIQQRLGEIAENISDLIKEKIADSKDLWDANAKWNKIKNGFSSIVGSTVWTDAAGKEYDITGESPRFTNCGVRFLHYSRKWKDNNEFRKTTSEYQTFSISDQSVVIYNDERSKRPNRRRLRTLFEDENIQKVCVIQWPEDDAKKKEAEKALADKHIDLFNVGDITDYDKAELQKSTGGGGSGGPITKIWKFRPDRSNKKLSWDNEIDDQKDLVENGEGVYVMLYSRDACFASKSDKIKDGMKILSRYDLSKIVNALDIEVHGVGLRGVKKLGNKWRPLEDVMKERIDELMQEPDLAKKFALHSNTDNNSHTAENRLSNLWGLMKDVFDDRLTNKDGAMYKYLNWSKEHAADRSSITKLTSLSKIYNVYFDTKLGPKYDDTKKVSLRDEFGEVMKVYPLFAKLDFYLYGASSKGETFINDLFDYLNAKDLQIEMKAQQAQWTDDNEKEVNEEAA